MIHFYRPLTAITAITFDLDDTLYDNHLIILRAEQQTTHFLTQHYPDLPALPLADFQQMRGRLLMQYPDIHHDVSQWRWQTMCSWLMTRGLARSAAQNLADSAMDHFCWWRNQIHVPEETHHTLRALAAHYPLAAITNGNACPHAFGLGDYFQFVLHAGRAEADMYYQAARLFARQPKTLLHVGDSLTTDVAGALGCGMQACWINERKNIIVIKNNRLLPHVEISQLACLTALL